MIKICEIESLTPVTNVFEPFTDVIDDIKLVFNNNCINVCQVDKSNSFMLNVVHKCNIESEAVCGVSLDDILSISSSPSILSFENNKLIIKQGRKTTKLALISNQYIKDKPFPVIKWDNVKIELTKEDIADIYDITRKKDQADKMHFTIKDSLVISTETSGTKEESVDIPITNAHQFSSSFSCTLINGLLKYHNKFDNYTINIGQDVPVVITMNNDNTYFSSVCAPRFNET